MTGSRKPAAGGGRVKRLAESGLSKPERAALRYHRRYHRDVEATCWCCCRECKRSNPHRPGAVAAALDDIRARIRDSVATAQLSKQGQRDDMS